MGVIIHQTRALSGGAGLLYQQMLFELLCMFLFLLHPNKIVYVVPLDAALICLYHNKKPPILLGGESAETVNG